MNLRLEYLLRSNSVAGGGTTMPQTDWQPSFWDTALFVVLHYGGCYVMPTAVVVLLLVLWLRAASRGRPG